MKSRTKQLHKFLQLYKETQTNKPKQQETTRISNIFKTKQRDTLIMNRQNLKLQHKAPT